MQPENIRLAESSAHKIRILPIQTVPRPQKTES